MMQMGVCAGAEEQSERGRSAAGHPKCQRQQSVCGLRSTEWVPKCWHSCTLTLEHNSHHAQTVVVQPLAHGLFLLSSLSFPILQIPPGPVSIWVRWSVSSAQGSTETWGLTCPVCARWTWTTGRESSHRCWLPSETTWPTASGRAAPKDGPNPHRVRHGGSSQITAHVKNCCKEPCTPYTSFKQIKCTESVSWQHFMKNVKSF